jgi:hypothetical protein
VAVTSAKSKRFNLFSLDAINFLLADVRGALGPYLNVFLVTQQHWSQTDVGLVTTFSGLLGLAAAPREAPSCWRSPCWLSGLL